MSDGKGIAGIMARRAAEKAANGEMLPGLPYEGSPDYTNAAQAPTAEGTSPDFLSAIENRTLKSHANKVGGDGTLKVAAKPDDGMIIS